MRGLRFASVLLALMAGGAGAQPGGGSAQVDYLVVRKAARAIELYSEGRRIGAIGAIQLGDEPAGPKRFQGDERTPEGRYTIDYGNPDSAYHLSLHISYPDARDAAFAASYGRHPGGAIFIHGQPNGHPGRVPGDWTDGCIAVSNAEIEYLWQVVPDGAVIDILP
ncbi:MAG: L,D-transpeptidase family protein [Novosphingobium sp.]|nr:L,D-transpeptidase family protein [Novosphingobium sp.]